MRLRSFLPLIGLGLLVFDLVCTGIGGQTVSSDPASAVRNSMSRRALIPLTEGFHLSPVAGRENRLQELISSGEARPISMVSGDFDEDGIKDLICGFEAGDGGLLALYRGDIDFLHSSEALLHPGEVLGRGELSPFQKGPQLVTISSVPRFLEVGDFDADGHWDAVYSDGREAALFLRRGDGEGRLRAEERIALNGPVTALAAGDVNRPDGLVDLVLGISDGSRSFLSVLESPEGAIQARPEQFEVAEPVLDIAIGRLDEEFGNDVVAAAGRILLLLFGRDRKLGWDEQTRLSVPEAQIETHFFSKSILGLETGSFDGDYSRMELAVLFEGGEVAIGPAGDQEGSMVRRTLFRSEGIPQSEGLATGFRMTLAKVSTSPGQDLVIFHPEWDLLSIVTESRQDRSASLLEFPNVFASGLSIPAVPVAVLAMRLNADGLDDLVVLGETGPVVYLTSPLESYTVNDAGDEPDTAYDRNCNASTDPQGNKCTLRAALQEAQGCASCSIQFSEELKGDIQPASPLGGITGNVTLIGREKGDKIVIDGSAAGPQVGGLTVSGNNNVVRGLAIRSFSLAAIRLSGPAGNNRIEGNELSASRQEIYLESTFGPVSGNFIGGTDASAGNEIFGGGGIFFSGDHHGETDNKVQGNYLGRLAPAGGGIGSHAGGEETRNTIGGTEPGAGNYVTYTTGGISAGNGDLIQGNLVANTLWTGIGIRSLSSNVTIGGTSPNAANVIYGNAIMGVGGGGPGLLIQGNFIGTDPIEGRDLGNTAGGLQVRGPGMIGGTTANAANTIAFNKGFGISTYPGDGLELRSNSIYENEGLGIDDAWRKGKPPELRFLSLNSVEISIPQGNPGEEYVVEFFASDACDPSGFGEGKTPLDLITVIAGTPEIISFPNGVAALTATATDLSKTTSAFSNCLGEIICPTQIEFCQVDIIVNSTRDGEGSGDISDTDGICSTGRKVGQDVQCDPLVAGDCECTLRAAIEHAQLDTGRAGLRDTILFRPKEPPYNKITLENELPEITDPVVIDGALEEGGRMQLLGNGPGVGDGLRLTFLASGSSVRSLVIGRFPGSGIHLDRGENHLLEGNYIGVDEEGRSIPNRIGILLTGSTNNTIGGVNPLSRNLIAGNANAGVTMLGDTSTGNKIWGNYIGHDGERAVPNGTGIEIVGGFANQVGGDEEGAQNVISGNNLAGVAISDGGSLNVIEGNLIGTDPSGAVALGNGTGVLVLNAGTNWIGSRGKGNVISGNRAHGVEVYGSEAAGNLILDNVIGTDLGGGGSVPNGSDGVRLTADAGLNRIGDKGFGNRVAFNHGFGIWDDGNNNYFFENLTYGNRYGVGTPPNRPKALMMRALISPDPISPDDLIRVSARFGEGERGLDFWYEFYASPSCPHPQGRWLLFGLEPETAKRFTRYGDKSESFTIGGRSPAVAVGNYVTAIASTAEDGTGVYSNCIQIQTDSDRDGIADDYDPDAADARVAGILIQLGTAAEPTPVGLRTSSGRFDGVDTVNPPGPPPQGPLLPARFIEQLIDLGLSASEETAGSWRQTGKSTRVTLETPTGFAVETYLNYGPTPENPEDHWYEFLFDGVTGAEILPERVVLHLVDGQRGDHDLTVNERIHTLGGPAVAGFSQFLPFLQSEPERFVGLALTNPSNSRNLSELTAFGPEGTLATFPADPVTFEIAAGNQFARLSREFFEVPRDYSEDSWLQLVADTPEVGSFFQFGTNSLSQLDGGVAVTETAKKLYFTRVFEGASSFRGQAATTYLSIANPGIESIEVALTLHAAVNEARGSALRVHTAPLQTTHTIPGKGFLYGSVRELLGEESVAGGYLVADVIQGEGAVGFEVVQLESVETVIGLNAASVSDKTEFYSAQLASVAGLFTNVNLINTSAQERRVTLTAVDSDGSTFADPVEFVLKAGEQISRDAAQLFSLQATSWRSADQQLSLVGSLRVETDGGGILGDVIFGDWNSLNYAAALPLQTRAFREAVFNHVAVIPDLFFTGLAFFNPGLQNAAFSVEVFRSNGELVGTAEDMLPAGQRVSALVNEFVEEAGDQAGGYVRVKSNQPLIGQMLFGAFQDEGISLFSAVPPTLVPATLIAGTNPILQCDGTGLAQAQLSWNAPQVDGVEIRIGSPEGTLLASSTNAGTKETGKWVKDGTLFYLIDPSSGETLASVRVRVFAHGCD